jgi:hypothetical protein
MRAKVWFHRSRALIWVIVGVLSFIYDWSDSVTLVWIASLYANVVSDIGAAEASDDRAVTGRLDRIETLLQQRGDNAPR